MEADPGTLGLNQCVARPAGGGGGGRGAKGRTAAALDAAGKRRRTDELAERAGCWDRDEAEAWLEPAPPAFVLRGVDCQEGTFVVKPL